MNSGEPVRSAIIMSAAARGAYRALRTRCALHNPRVELTPTDIAADVLVETLRDGPRYTDVPPSLFVAMGWRRMTDYLRELFGGRRLPSGRTRCPTRNHRIEANSISLNANIGGSGRSNPLPLTDLLPEDPGRERRESGRVYLMDELCIAVIKAGLPLNRIDVLRMQVDGWSNSDIGRHVGLLPSSVDSYAYFSKRVLRADPILRMLYKRLTRRKQIPRRKGDLTNK